MNTRILRLAVLAAVSSSALVSSAYEHAGILVANDYETNPQEKAAYDFFIKENPDGTVIKAGETSKIDASKLDYIWIHLDKCGVEKGVLPSEIADEATLAALRTFVENGGNLYLSKQATQYLSKIGRTDAKFDPNIFGSGEGGEGTDVWTVNAQIGYTNVTNDPAQFYDHRGHAIYNGLRTNNDFTCETFALEGNGNGTSMWREDHNCCWDLNAYAYTSESANTVAKFEADNNAIILGTWGHVVDYAVAGIVEFLPRNPKEGTIIANGLAACEWAPRNGGNAYHNNLEALTSNTFAYLKHEQANWSVQQDWNLDFTPGLSEGETPSYFHKYVIAGQNGLTDNSICNSTLNDDATKFGQVFTAAIAPAFTPVNKEDLASYHKDREDLYYEEATIEFTDANTLVVNAKVAGKYTITLNCASANNFAQSQTSFDIEIKPSLKSDYIWFDGPGLATDDDKNYTLCFPEGSQVENLTDDDYIVKDIDTRCITYGGDGNNGIWYKVSYHENQTDNTTDNIIAYAPAEDGWQKLTNAGINLKNAKSLDLYLETNGTSTQQHYDITPGITTGIEEVNAIHDGEIIWYDLNGTRVENPLHGLYIRIKDGKATKTLILK